MFLAVFPYVPFEMPKFVSEFLSTFLVALVVWWAYWRIFVRKRNQLELRLAILTSLGMQIVLDIISKEDLVSMIAAVSAGVLAVIITYRMAEKLDPSKV